MRPKIMTVVAIMAGLLPILWRTGTGSELMRRIAVPKVGGMVSSTLVTVLVIPAIYAIIKGWWLPHSAEAAAPLASGAQCRPSVNSALPSRAADQEGLTMEYEQWLR